MKILLTGSNGMLGSQLLKSLAENGFPVLATGKGEFKHNSLIFNDIIKYTEMDLLDHGSVEKTIIDYKPTHILHLAAITQVDECEQNRELCYSVNVDSTSCIIKLAEQLSAKLIYLSTDFVFDGLNGPYKEDDHVCPVNYYGTTKIEAENILLQSKVNHCIIRTILLYDKPSDTGRTNFINWVKGNLEKNSPIQVVDDQIRTPTYIPDLVKAILEVIKRDTRGIYHVSGADTLSPYEMAIAVAEHLGLDKSLITAVNASTFNQPAKRPLKTGFIIDKVRKDMNYIPTPFKQSLQVIFSN
jgi:dTDP-4-dehydrorhamnose reductase